MLRSKQNRKPDWVKFLCAFACLPEIFDMPATEQIRSKLSQLPHKPGVYLDEGTGLARVIYVGKATRFAEVL